MFSKLPIKLCLVGEKFLDKANDKFFVISLFLLFLNIVGIGFGSLKEIPFLLPILLTCKK